jgi:GntR family transcriptional regulator, transcriptional repressor for pyruvate dehydrogenase complex
VNIRPVQKSSAAGKVFETLYEMIASGQFKPGEILPSQDDLALRFGVSRNTLREAIHKLSAMGLLLPAQGVGTVVQPLSPAGFLDSLDGRLLLDSLTVREFVEARICVERTTVRLAVSRSGPQDAKRLREIIRSQKQASEDGDVHGFIRQDVAFHMELARMSDNRVLLKFLQTIWGMLHEFITEVSGLPGAIQDAMRFHSDILAALSAKDPDSAEEKMLRHLLDVVRRIERNIHVDLEATSLFGIDRFASSSTETVRKKARRFKKP